MKEISFDGKHIGLTAHGQQLTGVFRPPHLILLRGGKVMGKIEIQVIGRRYIKRFVWWPARRWRINARDAICQKGGWIWLQNAMKIEEKYGGPLNENWQVVGLLRERDAVLDALLS